MRRYWSEDKGRSRNLVIPDSLYDRLCLYALRTETKVKDERKVGNKTEEAVYRSLNVSEAACIAIDAYLRRKPVDDDGQGD